MANWNDQISTIQKLREKRRAADESLYVAQVNLLKAKDDPNKRKEWEEKKKVAQSAFNQAITDLQNAIAGIYADIHPRSVIKNLDDSIPFLLLPVRIETRFMAKGDAHELWLRVYPDDIAVHTHEKTLTDEEVAKGEIYWRAIFRAEKQGANDEEKDEFKKAAWTTIVEFFGPQRSAWIASETRPTNFNDIQTLPGEDQLNFPAHDLTKTNAWSRAPRTDVMPDRFVVLLYGESETPIEVVGEVISDELLMGPDPMEPDVSFQESVDDKTLSFGETFNWTSDFKKAVTKGMGFIIPLTRIRPSMVFVKYWYWEFTCLPVKRKVTRQWKS
jgi:hypothetical protein